jgi:hypothetical protein
MANAIAQMVAECLHETKRTSVWSERLEKYVCADTEEGRQALADQAGHVSVGHPTLSSEFKSVASIALIGTIFTLCLCVVLTFLAGREPHPLLEKVIMGCFDIVKIGIGAVAGLFAGRKLGGDKIAAA